MNSTFEAPVAATQDVFSKFYIQCTRSILNEYIIEYWGSTLDKITTRKLEK